MNYYSSESDGKDLVAQSNERIEEIIVGREIAEGIDNNIDSSIRRSWCDMWLGRCDSFFVFVVNGRYPGSSKNGHLEEGQMLIRRWFVFLSSRCSIHWEDHKKWRFQGCQSIDSISIGAEIWEHLPTSPSHRILELFYPTREIDNYYRDNIHLLFHFSTSLSNTINSKPFKIYWDRRMCYLEPMTRWMSLFENYSTTFGSWNLKVKWFHRCFDSSFFGHFAVIYSVLLSEDGSVLVPQHSSRMEGERNSSYISWGSLTHWVQAKRIRILTCSDLSTYSLNRGDLSNY